jgi:hypothetical protein
MKKMTLVIFVFCCMVATARQNNRLAYDAYFTGCWQTSDPKDGYLVTHEDYSFMLVKPLDGEKNDTITGKWKIRVVPSIMGNESQMVLKPKKGKKKIMGTGLLSRPAVIYQYYGADYYKVPCK